VNAEKTASIVDFTAEDLHRILNLNVNRCKSAVRHGRDHLVNRVINMRFVRLSRTEPMRSVSIMAFVGLNLRQSYDVDAFLNDIDNIIIIKRMLWSNNVTLHHAQRQNVTIVCSGSTVGLVAYIKDAAHVVSLDPMVFSTWISPQTHSNNTATCIDSVIPVQHVLRSFNCAIHSML
jgi:hypothetical protein